MLISTTSAGAVSYGPRLCGPPELACHISDTPLPFPKQFQFSLPPSRRLLRPLGSVFRSQYKPFYLTSSGTAQHTEGRLPPATRRLTGQPPHGRHTASEGAISRRNANGRSLPFYWFEKEALLWRETGRGAWSWRPPNADELESLMDVPAAHNFVPASAEGKKSTKLSEEARWNSLASGWQVRCVRTLAGIESAAAH